MNDKLSRILGNYAQQALRQEVNLTPKPGLVDPVTPGAHRDMDHALFLKSIAALAPFFHQYVQLGQYATSLAALFQATRQLGQTAEQAMLTATNGVNTHKGANFSFGFLLASLGWTLKQQSLKQLVARDFQPWLTNVQALTAGRLLPDFTNLATKSTLSYGEKLYKTAGITGIRGEAEAGYPVIAKTILPFLTTNEDAAPLRYWKLMLILMTQVTDTNLLHRGGLPGWQFVQPQAKQILQQPDDKLEANLIKFDQCLTAKYLSPGGTADYLSLGMFIDHLIAASWRLS